MAALRNPKHESFAHYVSLGKPLCRAYALAYGRIETDESLRGNASRLWNHLAASKKIRARVQELMKAKRKAAELTMQQALDDMLLTADLARQAGQYAASITAQKAIAGELFDLFRDKREIDVNVEIKARSKAELRALLVQEYGEAMTEQLWQHWSAPTPIEHDQGQDQGPRTALTRPYKPRPEHYYQRGC